MCIRDSLTIHQSDNLTVNNLSTFYLTNCLFIEVTNMRPHISGFNYTNSLSSGIFQSVGAGAHYLASSEYRNVGTANVSAGLVADLAQRTTYAPLEPVSYTHLRAHETPEHLVCR